VTYRQVVVGTDGSPTAEDAVRTAAGMAACFGARLTIVTAFERHPHAEAELQAEVPEDLRWALTDRHQAEEKAGHGRVIARQAGAGDVVVATDEGPAADVLLEIATDVGADLIVVGSRGMTGATRFLVGSVANTVSHHAHCDVLVVHTTT
jgi:nucleotide-binding universal stress UspA family protein